MKGSLDAALKLRLKQLIVTEADKEIAPETIADGEAMFGPGTRLQLDSIDGLQISMALQQAFGVRITDPKELARIMRSVDTLADYLQPS
jgi:acyl carrier protein